MRGFAIIVLCFLMLPVFLFVLNYVPEAGVMKSPPTNLAPIDVSLTIGDNNAPEITGFSPAQQVTADGDDNLYFSVNFIDLDGDLLNVKWYVDDNLIKETENLINFDEFNFIFGCGVEGNREVLVIVEDDFDSDRFVWDIDLSLVACSSGGGGGGGSSNQSGNSSFTISKSFIDVDLYVGESRRESFIVNNTGDFSLSFDLSPSGLEGIVSLSVEDFFLSSGNFRLIDVLFFPKNESPGIYTGNILVKAGSLEGFVNLALTILDEESLFDISMNLTENILVEGDRINAKIELQELGNTGGAEVLLEYFIKDYKDYETKISEEGVFVNGFRVLEKSFDIPPELGFGDYLFYVKLSYDDKTAIASQQFRISSVNFWYKVILTFIIADIIILIVAIAYYSYRKRKGLL